jgi:hypothetical protein
MAFDSLKSKLRERGMRGIVGVARFFRVMDDDHSGTLLLVSHCDGRQIVEEIKNDLGVRRATASSS